MEQRSRPHPPPSTISTTPSSSPKIRPSISNHPEPLNNSKEPIVIVHPVAEKEVLEDCAIIILIGTTGAGKSSFVEKLASKHRGSNIVGIAKSKLDAGTTQVAAYRVVHQFLNIWTTKPLIIVDTPGLADRRISEMGILRMIQRWLMAKNVKTVDRLFYMDSINDKKMTRSKLTSIEMFKSLCGQQAAHRAVVLTTMWDQLWNERLQQEGEHHHGLLYNTYLSKFGCKMDKFHNTFESAVDTLRRLGPGSTDSGDEKIECIAFGFQEKVEVRHTEVGKRSLELLRERYERLDDRLRFIQADIDQSAGVNAELDGLLHKELGELTHDLKEISDQLMEYSPDYKKFREQVHSQVERIVLSDLPTTGTAQVKLKNKLESWITRINRGPTEVPRTTSTRMHRTSCIQLPSIYEYDFGPQSSSLGRHI